jgi:membrane protease YdiL (CAAX protease family)
MPLENPEEKPLENPSPSTRAPSDRILLRSAMAWRPADFAIFVGLAVLAFLLTDVVVLFGFLGLKAANVWRVSLSDVQQNPFFLLTFQVVFHLFLLGFIYLLVFSKHEGGFWQLLAWRMPAQARRVQLFLAGLVLAAVVRFTPTLLPERGSFPLERMFSTPASAYAVAGFAILIAPLMEELIFRGILFGMFESIIGIRFAVVATALLFAGLHIPEYWGAWHHVMMITVVGLTFSVARGLTGSLAASYILHLAYNFALITILFFETDQFRNIQALIQP